MCSFRLMEVLKDIATGKEKMDMPRISNLAHRKVLDSLSSVSRKYNYRLISLIIKVELSPYQFNHKSIIIALSV